MVTLTFDISILPSKISAEIYSASVGYVLLLHHF